MHHQVQQLGDIRFKRTAFRLLLFRHRHGRVPANCRLGDGEKPFPIQDLARRRNELG